MRKVVLIILTLSFIGSINSFAQNKFSAETLWKLGRVSDMQVSPDGQYVLYGVTKYNLEDNKGQRDLFVVPVSGGNPVQLTITSYSEYNARWRPDGEKIGFLAPKDGIMQIWEMDKDGSNPKEISNSANSINGFEYAPTLDKIVCIMDVKLDETPNKMYLDLPEANAKIFDDLMYRHWNHWHDYAYSHVFIASYDTKGDVNIGKDIMEGERYDSPMNPWGGMEQINWSPDGKKLAYTCKKLTGKEYALSTNSDIYIYDLESGSTTNISEFNPGYDHDPVFSPDGSKIIWKSMETPGFEADKERMMLLDFASGKVTDLTKNLDQSASHYVWTEDGSTIYFISGKEATYQIFSLYVKTGNVSQITKGDHNYTNFGLAGDFIVGEKMSMSMPTEIFRITKKGKEEQITFTNKGVLDNVELASVEKRWVTTTDNKQMLTWVILPPGFDKSKKYPALLYCQGGPQSAVSQFWSYRWNFQMMAAHDYIIVAPNRRGLPTFGQEWNDQISGDYGGQNMKDYLSAIDAVSVESYVNSDKLGAVGASYGGYSVLWLAGNHNKRFKAFISHCGIFNFESMYGSTEEYFFVNHDYEGPYWEDPKPKSYEFSPHLFVKNWDTPIMLVTGANDFRIPYTQSLEAFNAAQLLDIPSRLLFFPEETHFVLQPQNAVLWQREFFRWLDTYLK